LYFALTEYLHTDEFPIHHDVDGDTVSKRELTGLKHVSAIKSVVSQRNDLPVGDGLVLDNGKKIKQPLNIDAT